MCTLSTKEKHKMIQTQNNPQAGLKQLTTPILLGRNSITDTREVEGGIQVAMRNTRMGLISLVVPADVEGLEVGRELHVLARLKSLDDTYSGLVVLEDGAKSFDQLVDYTFRTAERGTLAFPKILEPVEGGVVTTLHADMLMAISNGQRFARIAARLGVKSERNRMQSAKQSRLESAMDSKLAVKRYKNSFNGKHFRELIDTFTSENYYLGSYLNFTDAVVGATKLNRGLVSLKMRSNFDEIELDTYLEDSMAVYLLSMLRKLSAPFNEEDTIGLDVLNVYNDNMYITVDITKPISSTFDVLSYKSVKTTGVTYRVKDELLASYIKDEVEKVKGSVIDLGIAGHPTTDMAKVEIHCVLIENIENGSFMLYDADEQTPAGYFNRSRGETKENTNGNK